MNSRQLTQAEKEKIVEKIKAHLADSRHSNCRVGSKVKEVIGENVDAFTTNEISALVIKDKKYLRTRDSTDWTITINPEYTEPKFITFRDIAIWVFGVLGGVASMLIYDAITSNNGGKNKQETIPIQTEIEQQRHQSENELPADTTHLKPVPSDSSK